MICDKYCLEYHIRQCTGAFRRDLLHVFPQIHDSLNIVIAFQDSKANYFDSKNYDAEKDLCLENFFKFSEELLEKLTGHWSDYIDPSSGLPMKSDPAGFYSDVEACARVLHMNHRNVAGCFVIDHPIYGVSAYISSFLTVASLEVIEEAIRSIK